MFCDRYTTFIEGNCSTVDEKVFSQYFSNRLLSHFFVFVETKGVACRGTLGVSKYTQTLLVKNFDNLCGSGRINMSLLSLMLGDSDRYFVLSVQKLDMGHAWVIF